MSEYDTANEHKLCFQIGKLKRRIAELEAERRWIPVGERLPTEDGYYWALDIFKQEQKYKFVQGKWRDQSGMLVEYLATRVTHWMPLPESPEATHDR